MRKLLVAAVALTVLAGFGASPGTADPAPRATTTVRESGYLTAEDGTRLKYTVVRPDDGRRHPVLLQYEGYNAGSNPGRVNEVFMADALDSGYAVMGLSVRGTACSGGQFSLFDPHWGTDGALGVEWAADQPWSTGRVGMFSFSYAGITQLLTAEERPRGLVAIAPGMVVSDMYRDVGYPGGITNDQFPVLWEAALHVSWAQASQVATQEGDAECLANVAAHQALGVPEGVTAVGVQHPYDDRFFRTRSPQRRLARIDVPVLGEMAWQDEQTGPRGGLAFERTDPRTTWLIGTNGYHGMYAASPYAREQLLRFVDHYVAGKDNGWERTPHVQLLHESDVAAAEPAWVTRTDDRTPGRVRTWWLGDGGRLQDERPAGSGAVTSYLTPLPSPGLVDEALVVTPSTDYGLTWENTPVTPSGYAAFETGPLPRDTTITGSSSLDLWVASAVGDADVQVTITEVRPDGQETYVQRGWLRLSHRALDRRASTRTRPVHPHTQAALLQVEPGDPVRARVEVLPVTHTFRAGSSLRLWLDTPSQTGLWGFLPNPASPTQLTVLHDADHPSRLVTRVLPGRAPVPLPACGTLASQPCRPDPLA